jgi:hypothetical protein
MGTDKKVEFFKSVPIRLWPRLRECRLCQSAAKIVFRFSRRFEKILIRQLLMLQFPPSPESPESGPESDFLAIVSRL